MMWGSTVSLGRTLSISPSICFMTSMDQLFSKLTSLGLSTACFFLDLLRLRDFRKTLHFGTFGGPNLNFSRSDYLAITCLSQSLDMSLDMVIKPLPRVARWTRRDRKTKMLGKVVKEAAVVGNLRFICQPICETQPAYSQSVE
jgi:hypothetical protein